MACWRISGCPRMVQLGCPIEDHRGAQGMFYLYRLFGFSWWGPEDLFSVGPEDCWFILGFFRLEWWLPSTAILAEWLKVLVPTRIYLGSLHKADLWKFPPPPWKQPSPCFFFRGLEIPFVLPIQSSQQASAISSIAIPRCWKCISTCTCIAQQQVPPPCFFRLMHW